MKPSTLQIKITILLWGVLATGVFALGLFLWNKTTKYLSDQRIIREQKNKRGLK
jgi:hypothetical protein